MTVRPVINVSFIEHENGDMTIEPSYKYFSHLGADTEIDGKTFLYGDKKHRKLRQVRLEQNFFRLIAQNIMGYPARNDKNKRWVLKGEQAPFVCSMLHLKLNKYCKDSSFSDDKGNELLTLHWKKEVTPAKSVQIRVTSGIDWLEGNIVVDGDIVSIQQAIQEFKASCTVAGKSLNEEDADKLDYLSMYQDRGRAALMMALSQVGAIVDQEANQAYKEVLADYTNRFESAVVPQALNATLYPHQVTGLSWLQYLTKTGFGGILADDMGLGKTIQTLAWLLWKSKEMEHTNHLIAVPKSVLLNWAAECQRFCPTLMYHIYHGTKRKLPQQGLVITTHSCVRSDIDILENVDWHTVVIDEGQCIKAHKSAVSKAFKRLNATDRLVLSGTPVENNVLDLHSIMEFLNPGLLPEKRQYNAKWGANKSTQWEKRKGDALNRIMEPYMLRRRKEDELDLPQKSVKQVSLTMGVEQTKIYNEQKTVLSLAVEQASKKDKGIMILRSLSRLRQLCDVPQQCNPDWTGHSAKLDWLESQVDLWSFEDGKVLIFSQYVSFLQRISAMLDAKGHEHLILTGQTDNRQALVDQFQQDDSVRFFLISLKAGGVGLNLTRADKVVLSDPWWNPAVERQAVDRAYRIGQKRPVTVFELTCKDTIEQRVKMLQNVKGQMFSSVVDGGNDNGRKTAIKTMSLKDTWDMLTE